LRICGFADLAIELWVVAIGKSRNQQIAKLRRAREHVLETNALHLP